MRLAALALLLAARGDELARGLEAYRAGKFPEAYEAFFAYCAVPWRTGAVRGRVKELMSMACDATPTHRYLPGMRLHLGNAVALGYGRTAILHALDIAAAAPAHPGVPAAGEAANRGRP